MAELREKEGKVINFFYIDIKKKIKIDSVVAIILSCLVFVLALVFKTKIASWIHATVSPFDTPPFNYTWINSSETAVVWNLEIYSDASYYYTTYLNEFVDWWNPYNRYDGPLDYYLYGPMFIYGLYFTFLLLNIAFPGLSQELLVENAVKWTALNFDALSAVMVYLLIINFSSLKEKRIKKHLLGLIGAFAFIFMPINLLYIDAYYLNIPQMVFFTLLSLLFFVKEKYKLSAYSLSVAWLTKQIPLFILIPMFSIIWKKHDIKTAFKKFLRPFLVSFLVFSIPWIFITPHLYIGRIFAAGRPLWYVTLGSEGFSHGVTFANTILYFGSKALANFYMWINIPMLPFILTYGFGLFVGHFNAKKLGSDDSIFFYYITWLFLIVHTFISRGIYKYYDAFLNPFLIISCILFINNFVDYLQNLIIKKKTIEVENKKTIQINAVKQALWFLLVVFLLLSLTIVIYYINWIIMIEIRFLHPLLLLGVLMLFSPLLPGSYYKEVFKKTNYKTLKTDFKEFFKYIKTSSISFYKRIKHFLRNIGRNTMKQD